MSSLLYNTAGQKVTILVFDDTGTISGQAANITAQIALDDGAYGACSGVGSIVEQQNGDKYEYDLPLSQAETLGLYKAKFLVDCPGYEAEVKGDPLDIRIATSVPVVLPGGQLSNIVIGDDYSEDAGRPFTWDVSPPANTTIDAGTVCKFGGDGGRDNVWLVTGTVSDLGGGLVRVSFDLEDTDTQDLRPGLYDWSVEIVNDNSQEVTVASGTVRLVEKHTN